MLEITWYYCPTTNTGQPAISTSMDTFGDFINKRVTTHVEGEKIVKLFMEDL
jgi:hypothetical protein